MQISTKTLITCAIKIIANQIGRMNEDMVTLRIFKLKYNDHYKNVATINFELLCQ